MCHAEAIRTRMTGVMETMKKDAVLLKAKPK